VCCRPIRNAEIICMQRINDETPFLFLTNEPGGTQNAEVMRDIDDLDVQKIGKFSNVLRSFPETLDDPNPIGFRDRLEQIRALLHLNFITHCGFQPCGKMKDRGAGANSVPEEDAFSDARTILSG
jgi:hypothetical protein